MSRVCEVCGKKPSIGNNVSHANNKTKHVFMANLQSKKIYIPEKKKFVRIKVSTRMIRTIDKLGLHAAMKKFGVTFADLGA